MPMKRKEETESETVSPQSENNTNLLPSLTFDTNVSVDGFIIVDKWLHSVVAADSRVMGKGDDV